MKKILIAISIIVITIISIGVYHNSNTVKLFENIDVNHIDEISVSYIGGTFNTKDRNQISEIMNYLKTLKFSKRSDNSVPNTTADALIGLSDEKGKAIIGLRFYGDVARVSPKEIEAYTMPSYFYENIEKLCKKCKESNK